MNFELLKDFCNEVKDIEGLKFIVAKFSEENPYWAVFGVTMKGRKKMFSGHCFCNELSLESVLDLLYSLDVKVEFSNKYML